MSEDRTAYTVGNDTPPTAAEIADRLRTLADDMRSIGVDMEYFGGFGKTGARGSELQSSAHDVREWAHEIEEGNE
jgi:hypothetical protein